MKRLYHSPIQREKKLHILITLVICYWSTIDLHLVLFLFSIRKYSLYWESIALGVQLNLYRPQL